MEVKEVVRAAQEAEVRGDLRRAAELLRRAQGLYREVGNLGRAGRMERHAARLEAAVADAVAPTGRGPVVAPSESEAVCSFCCRPRKEVGLLVTGPTHVFICRACATESLRLIS